MNRTGRAGLLVDWMVGVGGGPMMIPSKRQMLLIATVAALLLGVVALARWCDRGSIAHWRGQGTGYEHTTTRPTQ